MPASAPDRASSAADTGPRDRFGQDAAREPDAAEARRTALGISPGVLVAGIGGGMAFPILPLVGLEAGLSLPFIGIILAANRFGRVLSNPLVGAAVDRLGPKRVFLAGLVMQAGVLALYLAGVLTGHPGAFFLIGRLLHGPGSACVFVASQTLALNAGGREHRGLASGIVRSAQAAGVPAGLVLGGVLAGLIGPAGAFAVATAVPLAAAAYSRRTLPDLRASALRAPTVRESLAALLDRRICGIAVVNFTSSLAAQGVILTTLVLLIHQRAIRLWTLSDQTASGVFMAVLVASLVATTPAAGRLSDVPGRCGQLVAAGLALMAAGLLATAHTSSAAGLATGLALVGAGGGILSPALLALLGSVAPPEVRGSGVAALQLFGDAGGTIGPLLGTVLLARSGEAAYVGSAALLLLTLPVAAWLGALERRLPAGRW